MDSTRITLHLQQNHPFAPPIKVFRVKRQPCCQDWWPITQKHGQDTSWPASAWPGTCRSPWEVLSKWSEGGSKVVPLKKVWWMWGRKTKEDCFVCISQILQAHCLTLAELHSKAPKHASERDQSSGRKTIYSLLLPCWNPAKWASVSTDKANFRGEVTEKAKCQRWGLARESKSDNPDASSHVPFHSHKLHLKAYARQVWGQFQHKLLNSSEICFLTCCCFNLFASINKPINCSRPLWQQLVMP